MKRLAASLLLLAAFACDGEAKPLSAGDGIQCTPRASAPTVATGKRVIWCKTDGSVQVSSTIADMRMTAGQRITIPVTNPYASSTLASATTYSAVYYIPPDVTTVSVQVGQRQLFTPAGAAAASASTQKISCGAPSADRQSFTGTPTHHTGLTWPAYMPSTAVSCTRAVDASGYMMFRWTIPSGTSYLEYTSNAGQYGYVKSQVGTDPTLSSGWSDEAQPAGQLLISYTTSAPRLVIYNDSIMRGLAAGSECGLPNTLVRMGPGRGYAVSVTGVGFARAARYSLLDNWMLGGDITNATGAHVLIALGTNDLFGTACSQSTFCSGSDTSVNIIGHLRQTITNARAAGARSIGLATLITSAGYSGPQEAERLIINAWIRQQVGAVDYVLDMDTTVGTVGTNPTYFATGGVHLTTAAFTAIEAIFPVLN